MLPEKKYDFHSTGHDEYKGRGNSIIHWLPKDAKNASVEIRMPDNSIVKGIAEESVNSLEEGDIVQFTRFGFCRLDKKLEDKLSFWFTNK